MMRVAAVAVMAASSAAAQTMPASTPADEKLSPAYWLRKVEEEIAKIQDEQERDGALGYLALDYAEIGLVEQAKRIARSLQDDYCLISIGAVQAHAGDFVGAVASTKELGGESREFALSIIAGIRAKTDIAGALEIAGKLKKKSHSRARAFRWIVIEQAKQGDVKGAEASLPEVAEDTEEVFPMIAAAKVVAGRETLQAVARRAETDTAAVAGAALHIARHRLDHGNEKEARRIVGLLSDQKLDSNGYIAQAELLLDLGEKGRFADAIGKALASTKGLEMAISRAVAYMQIAALQVRAGDMEAARKTILKQAGPEAEKDPLGMFEALGGRKALIALLIKASKPEEAEKLARGPDGGVLPEAAELMAEAMGRQGKTGELGAILLSVKAPVRRAAVLRAFAAGLLARQKAQKEERKQNE